MFSRFFASMFRPYTIATILSLSLLILSPWPNAFGQKDEWLTYYEKSGFKGTPRYDETISYCKRLDQASPWITYTTFGTSPQGRKLPLLIIDKNGYFDPSSARRSGNLVVLIMAGIHPGEIDGKDAMLMLFRDIGILQEDTDLLDHLTVLFIPIFNVDGHERFSPYNRINQDGPEEMGWRTTAQNLNLNRDFLKADTPEMQAWLKLFQQWLPDFCIDIHVTDGADYQYASTYGIETFGNMDQGLTTWAESNLAPVMEQKMDEAGYPIFPYVMFRKWHDPRSGLRSGAASPRFSIGYAAIQNRIALLIENHSLKDYNTRVSASYEQVKIILRLLNMQYTELKALNDIADSFTASAHLRDAPFALQFTTGKDSIMLEFRGVGYDKVTSDLTGGDWFQYHPDKPQTFQIPYFNHQEQSVSVRLPEAYIIPPEWSPVIDRLGLHGIKYFILKKPGNILVQSYKFKDPSWNKNPYEGRFPLTVNYDTILEEREYPAGSVLIDMNQRTARVIAHIFEPDAPDSYVGWGFFNTIFEQKEYFETYVMEEYARKMIAENPSLKNEFEKRKKDNPEFAKDQYAQLQWFFERSPYWDKKKDVYPVGRIFDRKVVEELKN